MSTNSTKSERFNLLGTQQFERPGLIMVIDDEPNLQRVFKEYLERCLHTVVTASSGREALQVARENGPEVIVLDVQLPDMSGFDICRAFKTDPGLQNVPVMMVSGMHDRESQIQAAECGAVEYLYKPVDLALLEARVRTQLKYRRAITALRKAHDELDKRVKARTEELLRANEELRKEIMERQRAETAVQESDARLQLLFEHMDPIFVHDFEGNFIMANQAACDQLGYTRDELLKKNLRDIVPGTFSETVYREIWNKLERQPRLLMNGRHKRKDGTPFPVEISNAVLELGGKKLMICLAHDITEREMQEEALRASEERYALAAEAANDGLWDWNLRTQELYLSPRWKALIGISDQLTNNPDEWFRRVHPDDIQRLRDNIESHLAEATPHFQSEYRIHHRDGSYRWMLSRGRAIRDENNKAYRMVGSQTDITSRKSAEIQLMHDAFHDALTGLANRALFIDRLGQTLRRAKTNEGYRGAVLFVGVDRFKNINESLGHRRGDQVLREFGRRLESAIRPVDTVAHLAGDEFAVLLEDIGDSGRASAEAERIRKALSVPFMIAEQEVFISATIGIASASASYNHPEDVLRDADTAMHRAKATRKGTQLVFQSGMHASISTALQMESDLRRAVERNEFCVFYQPIMSLKTGKLAGFEALVRWRKPPNTLVSPAEFIPLAEETGMIVPMSWWVLREACRQMKEWHAIHPQCYINVNLSSKLFSETNLIQEVKNALAETGLEPHTLKLELTESVIMEHTGTAMSLLNQLKDLNVQLVLDDFGTGYSSLSYLHRFPINVLKIDRSFVSRMGDHGTESEIVRTILTLARNLHMEVVAEGVEKPEQLTRLKNMDCTYAQGYFFAKPLDAEAAVAFLKQDLEH